MMKILKANDLTTDILLNVLIYFLIWAVKVTWERIINANNAMNPIRKRKWTVRIRTFTFLAFVLLTIVLWASEIRTLALSLAALVAAVAIATKELILSFCGTILRTVARPFSVGDRIEINGLRGDVIDQTLLSTTIMEIGPKGLSNQYTGRSVTLPNYLFLNTPVINETFFYNFVLHTFVVPVSASSNWEQLEHELLEACDIECGQYVQEAQDYMNIITKRKNLDEVSVKPRITLKMEKIGELQFMVRVAVPARLKGKIESMILRRYLLKESTLPSKAQASTNQGPLNV